MRVRRLETGGKLGQEPLQHQPRTVNVTMSLIDWGFSVQLIGVEITL